MSNFSILVVDDEPKNFEALETLLASEKYNLYYTSNGKDALASLDAFDPDLILLDVMMPDMDGLEVCERLKLMRKWRSIPIIMMTALPGEEIIEQCLQAGADDFLHKPIQGVELRARVKSMLRIKKQFDRIESLTRLQQHKISSLENDLSEFSADLAVWFADELNIPISNIIDQLEELSYKINDGHHSDLLKIVESGKRSARELEHLSSHFWVYIELAMERKQYRNGETCDIKAMIEQISKFKLQSLDRENDLSIYLENAQVAVSEQHCEWIVKELIDNALQFSRIGNPVEISGWVSNGQFNLQFSDQTSADLLACSEAELALPLSLKIVKRIVNSYDGLFLFSNANVNDRAVHITLPVA